MTKAKSYFILAFSMAVLGLAEALSGFILWLGFPSGGGQGWRGGLGGGELTFWGLAKHTWIDIHDWVAVALVALVLLHVILHWKWIVRMTRIILRGQPKNIIPVSVEND